MPLAPTLLAMPRPLSRCLGMAGVLFLTLSVATPASSVFVIVPGMLQVAGTGALWGLGLAALVGIATAFLYAELSAAWPVAGGEYVMVTRTLGPLAGFVVLGVNVFGNLLFPPIVALGVSDVLSVIVPDLPRIPVALAVIAFSTAIGLLNIRINALITGLFLAIELAALAIVTGLGLFDPARPLAGLLARPEMLAGYALVPASASAIGLATTIGIFALNGYGMAVYFGEEMHDAARRIAHVILASLALTLVTEIVPAVALLVGAPDLKATLAASDPFGAFVAARGGGGLARWMAGGVVVAIVNAAIVTILASARFFYATGRDRAWGRRCDTLLTAIHPRFESPWAATVAIGAVGAACCFLSIGYLLALSGASLIVTYAALALATIAGRRGGTTAHAPYRMPLFPAAPLFTLAALAYVVWSDWLDPLDGRPGLIATAAQMAAAAGYYWLVLRRRGWTALA